MYFEQQNFFPSLNQSYDDLQNNFQKDSSNHQSQQQLDQYLQHQSNEYSNAFPQTNQKQFKSNQNQPIIIDSQNQKSDLYKMYQSNDAVNEYSKYEQEIKEMLPQIHAHLIQKYYKQYQLNHQQKMQKYKSQLSQQYKEKIDCKIDQMKENINSNLEKHYEHAAEIKNQIKQCKKAKKQSSKTQFTPEQEEKLIDKTIEEIFSSNKHLNEIKFKLQPKIEQRVRFILIRDLENKLSKCQIQIEDKIAEEREQFKNKRKAHWQEQSQNELRDLAIQFEQIKGKKQSMQQAVRQKIAQKQQLTKKYNEAVQKFKEIKQIQKEIKKMQFDLRKPMNKIGATSRSVDKKIKTKLR